MRIVLIRHARTRWNDAKRLQGWSDTEPYPEALTSFWKMTEDIPLRPDVIFTSDLKRAKISGKLLLERYGSVPLIADWRLRERHMGKWEGRYSQEMVEEHPEILDVSFRMPGGESILDLYERVSKFADDLKWYCEKRDWQNVIVVSHQLAMETLRRKLLNLPVDGTMWDNLRSSGQWVLVEV
ncbi:MAG: histidine phosphatase family protein [Thermotogae bacterium]|nr:histidine phosphatase family protein [Thermotogota bacterium]